MYASPFLLRREESDRVLMGCSDGIVIRFADKQDLASGTPGLMANWRRRWRIIRRRMLPYWAVIATLWAIFATAFPLHIAYSDHKRELAKDRIAAREEVDEFMLDIRRNYLTFCDQKSEALRKTHKSRYDEMAKLASVDTSRPPYDKPCRFVSAPGAPKFLSLTVNPSHYAPAFADWQSFIGADKKMAVIWIDDIPLQMDLRSADWSAVEPQLQALKEQADDCTEDARLRAENAFIQIECQWYLDNENEIRLMRVETR